MTDIVQLKENGVGKYLTTHVDAVEGLKDAVVMKTGNESIAGTKNFTGALQSGGKDVATTNDIAQTNGTAAVGNGNAGTITYYKQLKVVTLFVNGLIGKGGGGNGSVIATLPNAARPAIDTMLIVGSTDVANLVTAVLLIRSNGQIVWSRCDNYASTFAGCVTFQTA